jgi:hypothetical protein
MGNNNAVLYLALGALFLAAAKDTATQPVVGGPPGGNPKRTVGPPPAGPPTTGSGTPPSSGDGSKPSSGGGSITLTPIDGTGITSTGTDTFTPAPGVNLPAGTPGNQYPVGSVFYDPVTGAPSSFVVDAGYAHIQEDISYWSQFHPGVPLPGNQASTLPPTPAHVEDFTPNYYKSAEGYWIDAEGTAVNPPGAPLGRLGSLPGSTTYGVPQNDPSSPLYDPNWMASHREG